MERAGRSLPQLVRDVGGIYLEQIEQLNRRIADLEKVLRREAQFGTETRRLNAMHGIGPIRAMAVEAFAPPMATLKRGRDFAAWLGLVPVQHSTGGKQRLGRTSKKGEREIPALFIFLKRGKGRPDTSSGFSLFKRWSRPPMALLRKSSRLMVALSAHGRKREPQF